jgi:hypothetical protein
MTVEVVRDLDARLRGRRFSTLWEKKRVVSLELSDGSLLEAACALPVILALREVTSHIEVLGDSLGATFARLALQTVAPVAPIARIARGQDLSRGGSPTSDRLIVRLAPSRERAHVDASSGELRIPCPRGPTGDGHPLERWTRGALGAGLPASRKPPRIALSATLLRSRRRALRTLGARTPLFLRAQIAPLAGTGARRSEAPGTDVIESAFASLRRERRLDAWTREVGPLGSFRDPDPDPDPDPDRLADALAEAVLATGVVGDDEGFLHAAAACGASVVAVGRETLAPPYENTVWVRSGASRDVANELDRLATARFPWDALALRRP